MGSEHTIAALERCDLPAVGVLFEAHTGRPADLTLLGSWVASSPAAGAYDGDTLVGYAICKPFAPDVAELATLLVHPDRRGRGIGSRLVAHVEAAGASRGLHALVTVASSGYQVLGEKRSSRPLYERLGYEAILETPCTAVLGRTLAGEQ